MGCLFSLFKGLLYTALLLLLLAGGFAGNMAYEELFHAPWDQILGIENHRRDLSQIHAMENRYGWQSVTVPSEDGTRLVHRKWKSKPPRRHPAAWSVPKSCHVRAICGYLP